ncbi:hypothetical protein BaRGS_00017141 [Batillaria attramentaria]|uniref:Uncharacterized protein n=1 Tax=Batillaria attramentaria TaxID=370345 RepID=A0ABD0KXL0_9CAEN
MALHAKILKHNILRVSKLRKLSHTTQAIEKNFEKNVSSCHRLDLEENLGCCSLSGNVCLQPEVSVLGPPKASSSWCTRLDLAELSPCQQQSVSLGHLPPQHKALMQLSVSGLETLLLSNSTDSVSGVFHPHDCLSSIVKPVSYTADDIFTQPADCSVQCSPALTSGQDVCENHVVTLVIKGDQDLDSDQTVLRTRLCDEGDFMTESDVIVQGNVRCSDIKVQVSECDQEAGSHGNVPPAELHTVLFSTEAGKRSAEREESTAPQGSEKGPNMDQLRTVERFFIESLPHLFKSRMDYSIYHPSVVFENNFWGKEEVTVGITQYATQIMKLRALTHLKYAHVHLEVVSSACLLEEGVVRIQWRIVGLSQLKALKFWKYTAWSYGKAFREDAEWIEGISILHVNKDGQVVKHRMDRMTPDEEQLTRKTPSLATRLAVIMGLSTPKTGLTDFSSFLCRRSMLAQKLT